MNPWLVVFTREPRLGRVKRRLAEGIGPVRALAFHRAMLHGLARTLGRDRRWRTVLAVTPDRAAPRMRAMPQGPGDLGARMERVLRSLPPGPVVLIGSDIPDVRPDHIVRAFRLLGLHDAVFGPAGDGGYWLIGLRRRPRFPSGLFRAVRWSTAHALADTLANLARPANRALTVALADRLDDVDDAEGFARVRR